MSEDVNANPPKSLGELTAKMELRGTVKRIELYGAFVDIGVGQDALLHISQLGQPNVRNVEDVVKVGDDVAVYVLKVDPAAGRVALSLVKPPDVTWDDLREGVVVTGTVVRIESFGAFVDIGAERPAMIHVSELSDGYVSSAGDIVKVGQVVQARIIKVDRKGHKIDLSMKSAAEPVVEIFDDEAEESSVPTAMELALRQAMEGKEEGRERRQKRERDIKEKRRHEQDEIIARTLRDHSS